MEQTVTVGNNIKRLRVERGMSQERLARDAGVSLMTVSGIENERQQPKIDTLRKLGGALGVSLGDLLG